MQPQDPTQPQAPQQDGLQSPQPQQPIPPAPAAPTFSQPAPQDTPAPAPSPVNSTPFTPQTPPAPAPTPLQHHTMGHDTHGMPGAAPKKGLNKGLIAAIVGVVVAAGLAVGAYFMFFAGIALEPYSNDDFSMQVPVGYEKEEVSDGSVKFTEKDDAKTASAVMGMYRKFPTTLTTTQVQQVKDLFKDQVDAQIEQVATGDRELKDIKVEDGKFKGEDAINISARALVDGKDAGTIKMVVVIDKEKIYMIGVIASVTDPGLAAKADTIIESFTLK